MNRIAPGNAEQQNSLLSKAEALDALESVLPFDRRDFLAEILTNEDIDTLRHLAKEGLGENSLKALVSDLGYLEAWCMAATGEPLPWPAPEALLIKFVAHHLWDPVRRESDPDHGMPQHVGDELRLLGLLRSEAPHAPSTVQRRLSSWSTLTRWRGLTGKFNGPTLRSAIRLAVRASARPRKRKSDRAVTSNVLKALLLTCSTNRLADIRDRALLLTAFASGGRRRSEVAGLRCEQLVSQESVLKDPDDPESPVLPCMKIRLGRTKTTQSDTDAYVLMIGQPVDALMTWLARANITEGSVFRRVDRWGNLEKRALTPQAVNLILKKRAAQAGLDPALFSAHGLRSGYLTETARRGIPLPEAMQQSQHRSVSQAARYYNEAERELGQAARVIV